MTLIAGIVSRKPESPVPSSVCDTLRQTISRDLRDKPVVFEDGRSFFVKVDICAFGEPTHGTGPGSSLTLLTGEPLLDDNNDGKPQSRGKDVVSIHDSFLRRDISILTNANGVFSAVHYKAANRTVDLISDKLGLRPIYFFVGDEYLIFASALRILEEVAEIPKRMDVRAVTQMVGLGYALGERTPYADIHLLRAAEVLTVTETGITRQKYWRWDEIETSSETEEDLLRELYRRFRKAVVRRNGDDSTTAAYLSGGLDSRCIVAALREHDVRVHTFNFARPNTQDQVFGLEFADKMGAIHEEVPKKAGDLVPDYSALMAEAWRSSNIRGNAPAERPNIVWSGEGGSVALGHVHLSEKIVELMRAGRIDEVIEEHFDRESSRVSPRIFRPELAEKIVASVRDDIKEELSNFRSQDRARAFYFHLLLNDQHRKLANHFENIDLHRLEFQLPFFDSSFLELIVAIPLDICLRHRLYVKWLSHFPTAVTAVPWQVYPGHEPCPVPIPTGLDYQWAASYQSAEHKARKRRVMKQAREVLRTGEFPGEILNKNNLRFAALVHATGLRDYQYLIGPAHTYHSYWQKCGGEWIF